MKGILFKPEMVVAIREGRKTQTRRVVNPQPPLWMAYISTVKRDDGKFFCHWQDGGSIECACWPKEEPMCARYRVGETVYLKEGWQIHGSEVAGGSFKDDQGGKLVYRVDSCPQDEVRWRNAMFMPEWASRYKIRITEVRAERLQDITEEDAKAEGVSLEGGPWITGGKFETYRAAFFGIWQRINGKTHPWERNPWCWAYSFEQAKEESRG